MDPRRAKWWRASYSGQRSGQHGPESFVWFVDVTESECPASAITQKSRELVEIVAQLQGLKEGTGSTMPAGDLPGYLVDAIRIVQSEGNAVESAQHEARSR